MAKTPKAKAAAPVAKVEIYPPPEVITVRSHRLACDGGGGALGHPKVWLEIGDAGFVECLYCDRRFVVGPGARPEDERLAPGVYEGSGGH
jgi:uncharacterized Zn-finger protein